MTFVMCGLAGLPPVVSGRPITDLDMTSYADNFTFLVSTPSIVEARTNQLCSTLVRLGGGNQLAIKPQKSIVTLFTLDTQQSLLHAEVRIEDVVAQLIRTLKILGVTLDTYFPSALIPRDCVERAARALNVMKALAGSSS